MDDWCELLLKFPVLSLYIHILSVKDPKEGIAKYEQDLVNLGTRFRELEMATDVDRLA